MLNKKKTPPIKIYRKIAFSFIGLTLLLILVIIYFSATQATITIVPAKEKISTDFLVTVKKSPQMTELANLDIISGRILEVTKEKSQKFKTAASEVEDVKATGKVKLINTSFRDQPLVATTRLLAKEGVLFRIKDDVVVISQGETKAEVAADQPGKQGEIGPTTFTIPGLNQTRQKEVYAESSEAMTGGTRKITAVTEQGINAAREQLVEDLNRLGLSELRNKLEKEEKLLSQKEVLETSLDTKLGAEVNEFTLKLKVRVIGIAFSEEKIMALAEEKLKTISSSDKELVGFGSENLSYELESYDKEKEIAKIKATAAGQAVLKPTSPVLDESKLLGLTAEEVKARLMSVPGVENTEVKFRPFWIQRTPKLKDHILIKIVK